MIEAQLESLITELRKLREAVEQQNALFRRVTKRRQQTHWYHHGRRLQPAQQAEWINNKEVVLALGGASSARDLLTASSAVQCATPAKKSRPG